MPQYSGSYIEYEYNSWGQLTDYSDSLGKTAAYSYYSDGLRSSKTVDSNTIKYYYNGGDVINETKNNTEYATNVMGVDGIISRRVNNHASYFFKNIHGDVVYSFAEGRYRSFQCDYSAWGKEYPVYDYYSNPLRYCGEYYDSESGLTYLRGRYYSSELRRFITEDPAKDGENWYAYCGNNPVMRIDPSGESWVSEKISDMWETTKWAFTNIFNFAGEAEKKAQRKFWRIGSQLLLRDHWGYETSAWMLEHSLQDNPSDECRGNDSHIAYLINNDSAYLNALDAAILKSDDGIVKGYLNNITFRDGDLYYSIHRATIYVDGYKQNNGSWLIHATMTDTYDFTEIQTYMDDIGFSWTASTGTIANDAAVISQATGAINPYKITVDFYTTRYVQ